MRSSSASRRPDERIVALPFRVAVGFLLLLILWTLLFDEATLSSDPNTYEFEAKLKANHTVSGDGGRIGVDGRQHTGLPKQDRLTFIPWRRFILRRHENYEKKRLKTVRNIPLGERVELHSLVNRVDLNGVPGRVIAFDAEVQLYTVRLRHGVGTFRLRPDNVRRLVVPPSSVISSSSSSGGGGGSGDYASNSPQTSSETRSVAHPRNSTTAKNKVMNKATLLTMLEGNIEKNSEVRGIPTQDPIEEQEVEKPTEVSGEKKKKEEEEEEEEESAAHPSNSQDRLRSMSYVFVCAACAFVGVKLFNTRTGVETVEDSPSAKTPPLKQQREAASPLPLHSPSSLEDGREPDQNDLVIRISPLSKLLNHSTTAGPSS